MVNTKNNEKIALFSKSLILENGLNIINIKDENFKNYIWWKCLTNPHDSFNPSKTKGFLVIRLLLYGYLNRISAYRSNKDDDLMFPYLKILLNDIEVYRTKILNNSLNIWDEKLELQIHYIKSKIEIQLYEMDETEGIVEDEYIGSAFINVCDLQLSRKYDIIIKYIDKKAILYDPYIYKNKINQESNKKKKNNIKENNNNACNKDVLKDYSSDYNVRIFVKLVKRNNCSNSILQLNTITSLNYKYVCKCNDLLKNYLNINHLYDEIKKIKLNVNTIWIPFFSIIYNFATWKTPFYSIFFVTFFCFSFIFSKYIFSFFLVTLSLIFFILVSIIKESDHLKYENFNIFEEKKKNNKRYNSLSYIKKSGKNSYRNIEDKEKYLNENNIENDKISNNSFLKDGSSIDFDSSNKENSILNLNSSNNKNNNSNGEEDDFDNDSGNKCTDEDADEENNLSIIKTFISSLIDDDVLNDFKYIHYILFCFTKSSDALFYILRKFGYFLVIFTLLLCVLNILFYPIVDKLLRYLIFSVGFALLTYNFKPTNIIYRFFICFHEYYFLRIKQKNINIFNN